MRPFPACALLLGLVLAVGHAEADDVSDQGRMLRVVGKANVAATPDRARLAVAVVSRAGIAREAAADNARRTDAVLKQLRRSAPEGAEIHTGSYSLAPEYEYVTREGRRVRELAGYVASSRVTVVTSDLDGVGTLIDEAIGSGADEIGSIEFFLADQAGARRQAMLEAGRNARVDAATLAESLGVGLGPLIEAYTVEASSPVRSSTMRMAAAADMAADVPTPISPGSVAVGVTVTAVFSVQ